MQKYQQFIVDELNRVAPGSGIDPRHVDGFIHLAWPNPAVLKEDDLREEVMIALVCIRDEIKEFGPKKGKERIEWIAKSFGL
jgi:hypothetical protein